MGNNLDKQPGFYTIFLGGDVEIRHRGDWGKRRSHKICTSPDPSSFIDGDLSNGDEKNTEAEQLDIYVELVKSSGRGAFGTEKVEDNVN